MPQLTRRALVYTLVLVFLLLSYVSYSHRIRWFGTKHGHTSFNHTACTDTTPFSPNQQPSTPIDNPSALGPIKRRNIAISSVFTYHFDVYMALAWTLDRIRDRTPGIRLRIFADTFHYGFENIAKNTGIYHGERYGANQLLPTMREQKGDMVDLLILGTCEIDLPKLHSELLAIWNERPEDQKFKLVCMVHNTEDLAWQAFIPEWSRRGVLRLVTLGDHVSATFKTKFDELSESRDLQNFTSGYESIPIDAHYPVLDIPGLPQKSSERILSKAVIQGSFDSVRRDYNNLFADLINSLHDNASSWGYHPLIGSRKSFVPDHRGAETPFELYLVGSGQIEIPDELAYMVTVYRNLDYEDFYRFIANCDIVVPAFSSSIYYRFMASSTVALALELNVPILGTLRLRKAYRYIDDDRVVVTRPAAMREVSALKALRTRDASFFLKSDPSGVGRNLSDILGLESAVDNMLEVGWVRQKKDVDEYKQELWHRNELLAERLLRDM